MDTLEQTIRIEIAAYKNTNPRGWAREYFNNYYCHFPTEKDQGMYRELATELDQWDERYSDPALSLKKRSMTRKEFYAEIDKTVTALQASGILPPLATRLTAKILTRFMENALSGFPDLDAFRERTEARTALHTMFCELYLPVYIALLKEGYSHHDLTS